MNRYILINHSAFKGIIELTITIEINQIVLKYNIFNIIGDIPQSIIQSITLNPNSTEIFNTINKELITSKSLLLGEAQQLFIYINELNNFYKENTNLFIQVQLPTFTLYMTYANLLNILTFINQFITNYEIIGTMIRSKIEQPKTLTTIEPISEKQLQNKLISENDINSDKLFISQLVQQQSNDIIIKDSLLNNIIKELFILFPNNTAQLYGCKLIMQEFENGHNISELKKIFTYDNIQNIITFHIHPLIQNNKLLSYSLTNELKDILYSFNFSSEEYIDKLIILSRYIYHIIKKYILIDNIDKKLLINNIIIPIKIIHILIFIYSYKLSNRINFFNIKSNNIGKIMNKLVNDCLNYINTKYGIMIGVKILFTNNNNNMCYLEDVYLETIPIIDKYRYLLLIDKQSFIDNVINDVSDIKEESKSLKLFYNKLPMSNPKLLNINNYIDKTKNQLLSYSYIKHNISQLKKSIILTKSYLDILKLSNLTTSIKLVDDNYNIIITKYADLIINYIFKDITNENFASTPPSTLYLIDNFIIQYLNDLNCDYTIYDVLFILYQIIIPHIIDSFNIWIFIDYFH